MNKAELSNNPLFSWENQSKQYPKYGNGIVYFKGIIKHGVWVDCLLYYGKDNILEGILNHFPFELYPYQKQGSVNIQVRPDKRRFGIATLLLNECISRFKINLFDQEYTPDGEIFIKKYIKKSRINIMNYEKL